ncbi:hypothetical protein NLG97_g7776 [Lecanicillium saksenae]|uniref:Uncharacterized protein n=1 Tax=Lecanicillium saksenae TaxID=468837 RepID=A0ACC1QLE1_9HYPO|nr:hypothetical protein NLG97_g7776 [Lecanicillium saksenae]
MMKAVLVSSVALLARAAPGAPPASTLIPHYDLFANGTMAFRTMIDVGNRLAASLNRRAADVCGFDVYIDEGKDYCPNEGYTEYTGFPGACYPYYTADGGGVSSAMFVANGCSKGKNQVVYQDIYDDGADRVCGAPTFSSTFEGPACITTHHFTAGMTVDEDYF